MNFQVNNQNTGKVVIIEYVFIKGSKSNTYQLVTLTVHLVKQQTVTDIKHNTTKEKESSENRRFTQEF
jgi:hypothetical protein